MSDTDAPSTSNAGSPHTPVKKNPCGKFIGSGQKQMIVNLYKRKIAEQPSITVNEVVKLLSRDTGIGQNTIQRTIAGYKNAKPLQSPNKKKIRLTFKEKVDDFERNAIVLYYLFFLPKSVLYSNATLPCNECDSARLFL
ncbi:unnamed protein product [Macrosiphum euphorbiae]|uniref:Transposase n=1 Tax=Macrosiphum euphorbiae TaxID=13131 RepID=A0AAV0XF95_9HEMI|nr:unnamed protein product [Macrosiphum euphorbiae]CAI6367208.1 unnamed protein product [Macrosiphum euphorbiae]